MRIGLAIEHLDPRRGGAEQWAFQHVERLLARGHEVHVVAGAVAGPAAQLPLVRYCFGRIRSVAERARAAEEQIRRLDVDVIHNMGAGWTGHILHSEDGSRLAQWERKLAVLPPWLRPWKRAMLGVLPRYRQFRRLMARQFGEPRRIVLAVSRMCARDYQQYHGVPPERIRLIYHGADNERFSPEHRRQWRQNVRERLRVADNEVLLLFVGHDYARKGLRTALRAVERLAAEGCRARLAVVGGNRRSRSMRLTDAQRALVTLVGTIDDPVPYYAAADAFVLPTFYDPSSLSVSEAAASGLPCVTTRFNGAAELLTEGVDGFVLDDPADDAALADRLRRLLSADVRRRMGAAARQLALEHSLDRNCDEIVAMYQEIAEQRRCAA
ncbi:MAG: glycosyltransferase family 4 protein [Thermoguttaceae bacterium]|jgi:UDP-glucose:(heptosyl)LPS alpha-1,3-glucosyltransferase